MVVIADACVTNSRIISNFQSTNIFRRYKLTVPEHLSNLARLHALKGHAVAMKHNGTTQAAVVLP